MTQNPGYRWRIRTISLVLLWFFFLISYLGIANFLLTAPLIRADLGLTYSQIGLAMGAAFIGYFFCQGLGCPLGERLGPRKLLTLTLLLSAALLSLTGFASSFVMLLAFRALSGGTLALHPSATWACMYNWIPRNELTRANTATLTSSTLAGVLAPLLVAALLQVMSWRYSFSVTAALTLVLAFVIWRNLRDRPEQHPGITPEELEEIRQGNRIVAHLSKPPTARALRVLARPSVLLLCLIYFLQSAAVWSCLAWTGFYLVEARGLSVTAMCLKMPIIFTVALVGTLLSPTLCDKLFRGRLRLYMAALWIAGAIFLYRAQAAQDINASVSFLALAIAFGCFMHSGVFWGLPRSILPPSPYMRAVSLIINAGQIGPITGIVVIGWIADTHGLDSAFLNIQVWLMLAAALILLVPGKKLSPGAVSQ